MDTILSGSHKGRRLKDRALEELRLYWVVFAFLTLMFGAFSLYRRLVLHEVGISYAHYGAALVEAAIIAKVILIGQAMKVGKGMERRPLIITVLAKAVLYGLLVAIFDVLERVVEGLFRGYEWQAIAHRLLVNGPTDALAQTVMVFVSFIPFFALWEIGRVLGPGKLWEMFFQGRRA
jgi:hypothetical protein